MAWVPVNRNDEAEPDADYRARIQIYSPYNVKNINATIGALKFGYNVANIASFDQLKKMMTIRDVEAYSAIHQDAVPYASDKSEPWELRVTFTKSRTGTPLYIVVGAILVLLIGVIGVTGWTVEKFNAGPAGGVLSFGVVLAIAFGGLFALGWLRGGRGVTP